MYFDTFDHEANIVWLAVLVEICKIQLKNLNVMQIKTNKTENIAFINLLNI